jgi:hypothetical protein
MGTVFSQLEPCGKIDMSPANYMDEIIQREEELRNGKRRIDVNSMAVTSIIHDIKNYMIGSHLMEGMEFLEEEENEDDYDDINDLK